MPVDFLTTTQRQRYGRYPDSLSADELARNFHLDDDDRECIAKKRRDSSRLGFALQLATVRFLGTFLEDPVAVPFTVLHFLAAQIDVADLTCVAAYRQSEQRWRHTAEIRARHGYREFIDGGVQFRLGRWLCALCWTGTDRPSLLFDHASGWLIGHKVLLPGISILERFIAEIRSRMETRLWRLLVRDVGIEQQRRLDELLALAEGSRQSWFDRLRKGPVRASGPALVQALLRVETVRGLGSSFRPRRFHPVASRLWRVSPTPLKSVLWPDCRLHGAPLPWLRSFIVWKRAPRTMPSMFLPYCCVTCLPRPSRPTARYACVR